jgi:hypothetical protein
METVDHSKNEARLKSRIRGKRNFYWNLYFSVLIVSDIQLLTSCNHFGNINTVKRSILSDIDHSISIGDALDKYKYFTKTTWEEFETDQGRRVVEFKGYYNMWEGVLRMQFILNKDLVKDEDGLSFRVGYMEASCKHYNGSVINARVDYRQLETVYRNAALHEDTPWGARFWQGTHGNRSRRRVFCDACIAEEIKMTDGKHYYL